MKNFFGNEETNCEAGYRRALKNEQDRERQWRKTAQGRLESSMASLDRLVESFDDPGKIAVFGDGGVGEQHVVEACDGERAPDRRRKCIKKAMNRLRNHPELRRTLRLIIKNGRHREDSIWGILLARKCPTWDAARKQYFAHLEKMLRIFCGQ